MLFAFVITAIACLLIFLLGKVDQCIIKSAFRKAAREADEMAEVSENTVKFDLVHHSALSRIVRRAQTLLANALGLGVAATYNLVLEGLLSIRGYSVWARSPQGAKACGAEASLLGSLPDPIALHIIYAYSLISLCSIANLKINSQRDRDGAEIEQSSVVAVQASVRGLYVRATRIPALRMRQTDLAPRGRLKEMSASECNAVSSTLTLFTATPSQLQPLIPTHAHTLRNKAVERLTRDGFGALRALELAKKKKIRMLRRLGVVQLRLILLNLISKCLGFLVGWACYDVLKEIITRRVLALHEALYYTLFALIVTLLCMTATVCYGREPKAEDKRSANERIFFISALGMAQGWAWSDVVDYGLRTYRRVLYQHQQVEEDSAFVKLGMLTANMTISTLMVVSNIYLMRPSARTARARWRRALYILRSLRRAGKLRMV